MLICMYNRLPHAWAKSVSYLCASTIICSPFLLRFLATTVDYKIFYAASGLESLCPLIFLVALEG